MRLTRTCSTDLQRGGKDMKPLTESGAVFRFDPAASQWTRLCPPADMPYPAARSYHSAAATSTHLIVHAGCGDATTGRLADVWAFDVAQVKWTRLTDAPGDARGGTALAHLDGKVYRMGGFNGKTELGGGIDVLTLPPLGDGAGDKAVGGRGEWKSVSYPSAPGLSRDPSDADRIPLSTDQGPGARSVTALLPLGSGSGSDSAPRLVAIMGEGKPSPTGGHDSAGNFWDDVWVYDPAAQTWTEVDVRNGPEARGWFAADTYKEGVVLWGGLNGANERLADGWVLE